MTNVIDTRSTVRWRQDLDHEKNRVYVKIRSLIESHNELSVFSGRVFAGMPGYGWHKWLFPRLLEDGVDTLGPNLHTMAQASHYAEWFDHLNYDHYDLFNVRYLITPAKSTRSSPPFGTTLYNDGIVKVSFVNASSGYFSVHTRCKTYKMSTKARSCLHPLLHDARFGRGHGRGVVP